MEGDSPFGNRVPRGFIAERTLGFKLPMGWTVAVQGPNCASISLLLCLSVSLHLFSDMWWESGGEEDMKINKAKLLSLKGPQSRHHVDR